MLTITRYINGQKIDEEDLKNYEVENETIQRIIKAVNDRMKAQAQDDFRQGALVENSS